MPPRKRRLKRSAWRRPHTLREVVRNADNVEGMGLNLAEFLDHFNFLLRKKSPAPCCSLRSVESLP